MSHRHDHRRLTIGTGLLLGGVAFFVPHAIDLSVIRDEGLFAGPTYERRILLSGLALFIAVLLTGLVARARNWRGSAFWTWLGALGGVVLLLASLGSGSQWLLGLGVSAAYAALPVAAAGLAGHTIRRLWERDPGPTEILVVPTGPFDRHSASPPNDAAADATEEAT